MNTVNKLRFFFHFIHTRFWLRHLGRKALLRRQKNKFQVFVKNTLTFATAFQTLTEKSNTKDNSQVLANYPIMDKDQFMAHFLGYNTVNISLEQARSTALTAEVSRNFEPTIDNYSVGLSSGTSGQPGIFLVSHEERARWAGILLAKTLPKNILYHLLCFWRPPLRIAFFLRANNNLYKTLNSRRLDFRFYDLTQPMAGHHQNLAQFLPHVLVAPSTILEAISERQAAGKLTLSPIRIINVAEVLSEDQTKKINQAFPNSPLHQIYQATEGFLGYTCENGKLHLNETHLIIERDWLDPSENRFQPIITDFSRHTQTLVRYRLNDILKIADQPCNCGRAESTLESIEGRSDEVLWMQSSENLHWLPIYPDTLRRLFAIQTPAFTHYRIIQNRAGLQIELAPEDQARWPQLCANFQHFFARSNLVLPALHLSTWQAEPANKKTRRILMEQRHDT